MPPARRPLRHRGFLAGAVLVALFAAASLLAPVLAPADPHAVASGGGATLEGPTASHPLGTDALGRDVLSRVLWGGRVSLAVGVGVRALVVVLGCVIGLLAGYFGGPVDAELLPVTVVVVACPSLASTLGSLAGIVHLIGRNPCRRPDVSGQGTVGGGFSRRGAAAGRARHEPARRRATRSARSSAACLTTRRDARTADGGSGKEPGATRPSRR